MKGFKEFFIRNSSITNAVIVLMPFLGLATATGFTISRHLFVVFMVPYVIIFGYMAYYDLSYINACTHCADKGMDKKERFCRTCGEPTLVRKKLEKICLSGHRQEDEYNRYSKCHKCGQAMEYDSGEALKPVNN